MDDEYRIIHSPLERRISERGISVEVLIYRGEDDAGWLLEVVDHAGGSTVWNGAFVSDRAALDAALRTITRGDAQGWFRYCKYLPQ